jgi:hypothetical protein
MLSADFCSVSAGGGLYLRQSAGKAPQNSIRNTNSAAQFQADFP